MPTIEDLNSSSMLLQNDSASSIDVTGVEEAVFVLFNVALMLAVIAGNGLILGAFVMNAHLRAVHSILIIGLSSADFLVGIISLPMWIYVSYCQYNYQDIDFYAYQVYITADIFIGAASILHLTGISIERCHAVLMPIKHKVLSKKIFYFGSTGAWLFAGAVASLQPLQYGNWEKVYTMLNAILFFFIPAVIVIIAYFFVFRRSKANPGASLIRHRASRAMLAREIRLSLTVGLITVLFVLAWLPLFSLTMAASFHLELFPDRLTTLRLLVFVKWMHYSSSAVNPFLYSYRNNDMKRTIKVIFEKHVLRKTDVCLKEMFPRGGTGVFSSKSGHRRCRQRSDSSQFSNESYKCKFRSEYDGNYKSTM